MASSWLNGWVRNALVLISFSITPIAAQPNQTPSQPLQSGGDQTPSRSAPQSEALSQSGAVLRVTTRMVVVDVIVTDRKGNPIADLKQEDFSLLEDGKHQQIRAFVFQGSPQASGTSPAALPRQPALQPHVVTNIRNFRNSGRLNVLLLDALNTRRDNQNYVKTQLLEFLKKLPAGEPVAVYLLGSRLQMLQDFTSDPAVLRQVITSMKDLSSPLLENAAGGPDRFWFEGIPLPPEMKRRALEWQQETESDETDHRVAITLSALNALARTLAGYPGRKNLIWVSESFPLTIVPNKVPNGESAMRASRTYNNVMAATSTLLADAQVAIYPVDARALVNSYVYTPTTQYDTRGNPLSSRNGGNMGKALDDTSEELIAARSTMEQIAEDTGGRAFYNRNDIGNSILQGMEDGSIYYELGYYPSDASWNGRFRKIAVKVKHPGISLRYRTGYFAADPQGYQKLDSRRRDEDLNNALSPELPAATALHFYAGVLPPSEQTAGKTVVNFAIDAHALSFLAGAEGKKQASVECAVRAFSAKRAGPPLKTEAETVNADLPPASYSKVMQMGLPCRTVVDLPAGEYLLRLGVRDNRTGLLGTANAQIVISETNGASAR